jgi:uncharacterized protein YukE
VTDVDPDLFYDAAAAYKDNSDAAADSLATLTGTGAANSAGSNGAGPTWATAFDATADQAGQVAYRLVNSLHNIGNLLQQDGVNHDQTELATTLNQRDADGDPVTPAGQSEGTFLTVASDIPSVAGGSTPTPDHWDLVADRIRDGWPNGNPANLRSIADAWSAFGHGLVAVNETAGPDELSLLANTEADEIFAATERMNMSHVITVDLAAAAGDLSRAAKDYGDKLESAQSDMAFVCTSLHAMLVILSAWPPQLRKIARKLKDLYTDIAVMQINGLGDGLRTTVTSTIGGLTTANTSLAGAIKDGDQLLALVPRKVAPTKAEVIRENQRKGAQGERRAGINTTEKRRIDVINPKPGRPRFRIPDELDDRNHVLREVKNVNTLSATRQIRDMAEWAQQNGYKMVIVVDNRTSVGTVEQRLEDQYRGLDVVIDRAGLS